MQAQADAESVRKYGPAVSDLASWIASAATMIAAMMTAANLGTRVTGWGFVVFTIGSIAWALVGLTSGQMSLTITNSFLVLVNLFGVWRWLQRQARIDQGREAAAERNKQRRHGPTLFSGGQFIGSKVEDSDGAVIGTVIDVMFASDTKQLSYVVVAQGGIGGAGEVLRAIAAAHFNIEYDAMRCSLSAAHIAALPPIDNKAWPAVAPEIPMRHPSSEGNSHAQVHHSPYLNEIYESVT